MPIEQNNLTVAPADSPCLSRSAVAARYGVHPTTIYRWVRDGRFPPPIPVGPKILRWRRSDLDRWDRSLEGALPDR